MKKFLIVLCTLLTACSLIQPKEEVKFKNPIFYQRMAVGGGQPHDELITPTSHTNIFDDKNTRPTVQTYPCELLENKETYIVLRCCYQKDQCHYSRYTSVQWDDYPFSSEGNCFVTVEETEELPFRKKRPAYQTFEKKDLPNHDCGPVKQLNYKKTMFPYRYSQEP